MLGETMKKSNNFGGVLVLKKKKKKIPFQSFFQGEDGSCQRRVFVLTSSPQQPRRRVLEGAGGLGCLWAPPGTAPRWGCSEHCHGGGWGGGYVCKSLCARGLCVCLRVCKGALGRWSSPAV